MSEHTLGVFVDYRATHNFHLGAVEGLEVYKDDILQYDGTTIVVGGAHHKIPAIKGAIKHKWLVPASDTTTTYASAQSEINVSGATNTARDRGAKFDSRTRNDEESDLGTITKVRDRGDGTVRRASRDSEDGVSVGRIKSPAVQNFSITNENVQSLTQQQRRLDNTEGSSGPLVDPIRSAKARVIETDQDIFGDDDHVVVGKAPRLDKTNPMGDAEPYLSSNERADRKAASVEAERQARIAASQASAPSSDSDIETLPADLANKVALVRAVIPNFTWDLTRPWKARVAEALRTYSKNPLYLNGILSVESDTVKTHITKQLSK